ncbi:MAG: ABC transporter ATP-binding protein [Lachnospiraceae bacterium]|nr:ABC transporter ATP-binding protein [Lachnospiraceae bacterium]
MSDREVLLDVRNLKKYFGLGHGKTLHAVDDISFTIEAGTTLGLVGESGCGKTTVGRTLVNLYNSDGGSIFFHGKDITNYSQRQIRKEKLACKMQMIFQDPYASLNPYFTVGEIISEGLDIHSIGANRAERQQMVYDLLDCVGLHREHANRFPHEFSGGQRQRVGIARALALNPEFIVCDEATSALDVSVQAQIINMLIDIQEQRNLTYLVVAHDLSVVRYISDRVAVMYSGKIVEIGDVDEVYDHPAHPYTVGLLDAVPVADPDYEKSRESKGMQGEVSSPVNPGPGCRFAARCPYATDECKNSTPQMKPLGGDHYAACHHLG